MALIGYARVSTEEQTTALQRDALQAACVTSIYEEQRSAVKRRPLLEVAIARLRPGDTLVVFKVDRIARSLIDLLDLLQRIERAGAHFRSLTESMDTSTPAGRMTIQMLGAFAEYERALIRERTVAGLNAARVRGARIGRPRGMSQEHEAAAVALVDQGATMSSVARKFGVHLSSVKRACLRVRNPLSSAVKTTMPGDVFASENPGSMR